ncbi:MULTISPECIES: cell wall metabolism sensor histidine kinase WalK [unclassified Arthrobacter]|uniref:sensor histidine kinase n=1 Tax=unclassified Arthrobacter TaxID=235627 RepID=UPI001D1481AD|nr:MULTISPECIES: ATP-binding protein [unclassified Arthrobacter]MCQ1988038.1 ATP-binding protein [Arthrobacter sp. zg-Y844]MCC3292342.1 two-component sensor histidine kinase [Arthrobacter sp. zg-Y1110]MCQ1996675.1 ATP-binding protein [Arthrobacter sp. zg-Y1171]UWX82272.1 ATP-binding protein [Arthrobacter sp. zg-Y1171]UWX85418.1 ATP-binding protein [Arthrobacter sp. zg-Y1110]
MNPVLLALLAGLLGLAVGAFGVLAYGASQRQRRELAEISEPTVPEGAAEVLGVIGRAYIVADAIDGVVRASPGAYAFGLVRGHTIVNDRLLDLCARVRRDGVIEEARLELPRGPLGEGSLILQVRVATVGEEYVLILADDRTEITRTEEVRHDFVANVSHELKTPVGAISLLSEALDDAAGDEEAVRRFAKRMHRESARLTALVQDIIELSRLQSTDIVDRAKPVDVNRILEDAVEANRLNAESKNIEVLVGGRSDAAVYGDAPMLTTAFRNLIDNAIRYSPEGSRVGIGLQSRNGMAQVAVTDQGPGIAPEEQERVFERFYRIDSARSRHTGGTGLGLSIVKHVVANHGGEVDLWSRPGHGSTFTVRLPEMDAADIRESKQGATA